MVLGAHEMLLCCLLAENLLSFHALGKVLDDSQLCVLRILHTSQVLLRVILSFVSASPYL